jgi:hypothetical protein
MSNCRLTRYALLGSVRSQASLHGPASAGHRIRDRGIGGTGMIWGLSQTVLGENLGYDRCKKGLAE